MMLSPKESSDIIQMDREGENKREKFYAKGYRNGVFAGKDAGFEEGSNIGFKKSVLEGYKFGIVRDVSSALALHPDKLREKLNDEEETREKFQKLHNSVQAISTETAMKLFYGTMTTKQGEEKVGEEGHGCGLGSFVSELSSLLDKSPKIKVSLHSNYLCGSVEGVRKIFDFAGDIYVDTISGGISKFGLCYFCCSRL